jgi:hypothetical protein
MTALLITSSADRAIQDLGFQRATISDAARSKGKMFIDLVTKQYRFKGAPAIDYIDMVAPHQRDLGSTACTNWHRETAAEMRIHT